MHELSLIKSVVNTIYDSFEGQPVRQVKTVTLKVGTVSGIVPRYLTEAWDWFTKNDDLFRGSKLKVEFIHAYSTCLDCNKDYDTIEHAKVCPYCHSENTVLKQGNELLIKEVEVI